MAIKRALVNYSGVIQEMNDEDELVGGVKINDTATTSATETWSIDKITSEITAAELDITYAPYAQLNKASITANEQTVHEILILNYDAGNIYQVYSDNTAVATISRLGNTITVTLQEVSSSILSASTNVYVSNQVTGYTHASIVTVPVTNYSVNVVDDMVQVTDFSVVESSSVDAVTTGALVCNSVDSSFFSVDITQEVGDRDWSTANTSIEYELTQYPYVFNKILMTVDAPTVEQDKPILLVDTVNEQLVTTVVETSSPSTANPLTDTLSMSVANGASDYGTSGSTYTYTATTVSNCGRVFFVGDGTYTQLLYGFATTAGDPATVGAYKVLVLDRAASGLITTGIAGIHLAGDDKSLYLIDHGGVYSGYAGLQKFTLTYDFVNQVITSTYVSTRKMIPDVINPNSAYDPSAPSFQQDIYVSNDEKYLFYCGPAVSDANGIIVKMEMTTAGNLSTLVWHSYTVDFNYIASSIHFSPDGKYCWTHVMYDDGFAQYQTRVQALTNAWDCPTVMGSNIIDTNDIETNPYNFFISWDGKWQYVVGDAADCIVRVQRPTPLWSTKILSPASTGTLGSIASVYNAPAVPAIKLAVSGVAISDLDVVNTAPLAVVDEPTLFTIFNGTATKTVTYAEVTSLFRNMRFHVDAAGACKVNMLKIALTKDQ